MSNDNTQLIQAIKDAENAIVKALNVLKTIASEPRDTSSGLPESVANTIALIGGNSSELERRREANRATWNRRFAQQNAWMCMCGSGNQEACVCNEFIK